MFRCLFQLVPQVFLLVLFIAVFEAILPYINVIAMHLICIFIQFTIAGSVSRKKPLTLIKNQVPGYTTALGTQSSAATIPVNLQCAEADGVCNCRLSDEPASDQSRNCHSVHHDTRHRNGRFPGSSWRFHHDCSSVPVHGIRRRSRRSGRRDLRHHGCTLHHTGFLRNSLQHFR